MNEEPMSKEQQQGQEPEVEQTGKIADDVLGIVSGGQDGPDPVRDFNFTLN